MKSLQIGDVYALQEGETGKWFAFQIIQIDEDSALHVDLDYWSDNKPQEKDLKNMSYFRYNHHFYNNGLNYCWSQIKFFPSHATLIGNMNVTPIDVDLCLGIWSDGCCQKSQEKWNKLPKDQVSAFKEAIAKWNNNEIIIIAGKELNKNLYELSDDTLSAVKDFSELDKLPGLSKITISKDYPHLIPFLQRRYLVRELVWNSCQQREVDLSRTHLEVLEISGSDIEVIHLPSSIRKLELKGKLSPNLRVYSPNEGYYMALYVDLHDDFFPNIGLSRLTELHLDNIRNYSILDISYRFPCIMQLWLTGKPGYIRDISEIAKFSELDTLSLWDIFGFSADDIPRPECFPKLKNLWIESVPAEVGKIIKKMYKGKVQDMWVIKLRSDEWLHENMNNPLRHWDGSEVVSKSKYTKSFALWKETRRRIMEETSNGEVDLSVIKYIAIDYVEGFNKLDRRSPFIETQECEDIFNAFEYILNETGLSEFKEEMMQIIDEKRIW